MKVCSACYVTKSLDCFYKHSSIKPDGIRAKCNDCRNVYRRVAHKKDPDIKRVQASNWSKQNKEKVKLAARIARIENPERYKGYCLKRDFGITVEEYRRMWDKQKGVCALCAKPETAKHQNGTVKSLAVDHCHDTGKIRGLLCWVCNTGIGKLQDSPALLRLAAEYIERQGVLK